MTGRPHDMPGSKMNPEPISVERYQRMIRCGILTEDDRVELLEGFIVVKPSRTPAHDGTIELVMETLLGVLPAGWKLRVQLAVTLPDSQPEPDFALVRGGTRGRMGRHPGPADVGLIVEVADSSLARDTADKARIYGSAGIPCYWVVNLTDGAVEVYTQPAGPSGYGDHQSVRPPGAIALTLDGAVVATVPVADLLP
jgi:hypothetical protein